MASLEDEGTRSGEISFHLSGEATFKAKNMVFFRNLLGLFGPVQLSALLCFETPFDHLYGRL